MTPPPSPWPQKKTGYATVHKKPSILRVKIRSDVLCISEEFYIYERTWVHLILGDTDNKDIERQSE